jgi:hypothetical protein
VLNGKIVWAWLKEKIALNLNKHSSAKPRLIRSIKIKNRDFLICTTEVSSKINIQIIGLCKHFDRLEGVREFSWHIH